MSKTKQSNDGHYEVLFIVPNRFTEEEAKTIVSKVDEIIEKNNGEITYREYWGKKKLAYEIKHNTYGYYALAEFDIKKEELAKIDLALRLSNDVLRYQIVSKRVKSDEEIAKNKEIQEKIDAKKEEVRKEEKEKEAKEEKIKEAKDKIKKEDKKGNLKDLDKKLEGILKADDLI